MTPMPDVAAPPVFTPSQLEMITVAVEPFLPSRRFALLQELAARLKGHREIADSILFEILHELAAKAD
jgi:hypothetical protein